MALNHKKSNLKRLKNPPSHRVVKNKHTTSISQETTSHPSSSFPPSTTHLDDSVVRRTKGVLVFWNVMEGGEEQGC